MRQKHPAGSEAAASPKKPRPPGFWLLLPTGLYLFWLLILSLANTMGPDRWWWSCFNLYLPQWIWSLPGFPLLALFLWKARRWAWLPTVGLLWVFGPLMGFSWRWFTPSADLSKGTRLRIMTYNVKYLRRDTKAILDDIDRYDPDVIVLQESDTRRVSAILDRLPSNWTSQRLVQHVIASRMPLNPVEQDSEWRRLGSHVYMRGQLMAGKTPVTLVSVHLLSPRYGLNSLRRHNLQGADSLMWNTKIRLAQAQIIRDWVRQQTGPIILCGDLNAPVQSLVCREMEKIGLRDAFSDAGRGYGYTYGHSMKFQHSFIRIDHILVSREWRVLNCWVGNAAGAEHRPVFADLYLPDSP